MGNPYYGRTHNEGRFDEERERWDERERWEERMQREGSRFDENRWHGRERSPGPSPMYGEGGWGRDDQRNPYGHERYYPGQSDGGRYDRSYRPPRTGYSNDERYSSGGYAGGGRHGAGPDRGFERYASDYERFAQARADRGHDEERNVFERIGDRVRDGLRRIGRGPKGFKRSDERISEDVCERIARSAINAENVEVKVKDGEVTLTGFVDARYDKRHLEDIADDVFGVTEVHNQLRVQPSHARSGTSTASAVAPTQQEKGRVTHS